MTKKTTASKKVTARNPEKYDTAYILFMNHVKQDEICQRLDVSPPTLKTWKVSGGWEEKRACRTISLDDLLHKSYKKINDLLDLNVADFSADAFSKAVQQLKSLKENHTVDDEISTFLAFQDYLIAERDSHKEVTDSFIKLVVKLQDIFILKRKNNAKR